jgi:hypothetical protein
MRCRGAQPLLDRQVLVERGVLPVGAATGEDHARAIVSGGPDLDAGGQIDAVQHDQAVPKAAAVAGRVIEGGEARALVGDVEACAGLPQLVGSPVRGEHADVTPGRRRNRGMTGRFARQPRAAHAQRGQEAPAR